MVHFIALLMFAFSRSVHGHIFRTLWFNFGLQPSPYTIVHAISSRLLRSHQFDGGGKETFKEGPKKAISASILVLVAMMESQRNKLDFES
jgi:hypothetical protein